MTLEVGCSFHHSGTEREKGLESDFVPCCGRITSRCSFTDRQKLEGNDL